MATINQKNKMFARLCKITDEERDAMSVEDYLSFCKEYEELHYALWPSSTLCVPNRMSPQERNKQNEERRKKIFS